MPRISRHEDGAGSVRFSAREVCAFNDHWPCSPLRERPLWFEFARNGDLVDTNVSEGEDGTAASALAGDAQAILFPSCPPSR